MRYQIIAMAFALATSTVAPQGTTPPKDGYVPDSKTAVKIAEAVLVPLYGESTVLRERPFTAKLKGDVWTIEGTMYCEGPDGKLVPGICPGGVAVVQLSKTDGRILSLVHYK